MYISFLSLLKSFREPSLISADAGSTRIIYQSAGSERIIQDPGCDDCTGLDHEQNLVSIDAPLGADISNASIDAGSFLYQKMKA